MPTKTTILRRTKSSGYAGRSCNDCWGEPDVAGFDDSCGIMSINHIHTGEERILGEGFKT